MCKATLSIIAPRWKQIKCPSPGEWVNELCYIHSLEYNLAKIPHKLLIHVTTYTMLGEIKLIQKSICIMIQFKLIARIGMV
jgi:hypothetical protein